ncbi:MAG TPA: EAL domain-containing protein [Pseudolabrys sp.]|nr:EAL domain-containing protein [Pseudolabrys sp.]
MSAPPAGQRRRRIFSASRLVVLIALLGICATFAATAVGYELARVSDERAAIERRVALREGIAEFRALFGKADEVDPRFVRLVEQSVQLKGLKFETDPAGTRDLQPVINSDGRIVGFFTWEHERPMTRLMDRLLPVIAGIVTAFAGFAAFCLWQLRRVRQVPAANDNVAPHAEIAGPSAADEKAVGPSSVAHSKPSADEAFIRRELPRALAAGELHLHYQPIVSAQGARIAGVEALLRWTHPERGAIGPATFVAVAERMELMDELGAFVLRRALTDARRWTGLYVAVNLSPVQLRDRAVVERVRATLHETGVDPTRLMLEITEGVLIERPDDVLRVIEELHALGVRIALDDFGAGYSNLGYLQRFPLDKLKIDRSLVANLSRGSNGAHIIQAVIVLGRALGVSVLAEGIETEEQRVLLRLAGCDEMQGYLFAKPGPAFMIDRLLTEARVRPEKTPVIRSVPAPARALTA